MIARLRFDRPVIPAEEMGTVRHVSELAAALEAEREAARLQVAERLEEARIEGAREGYQAGLARAIADMAELSAAFAAALKRLETDVGPLVVEVVEKVVGETPPAERLSGALRQVVERQHRTGSVEVSVSGEDFPLFESLLGEACRAAGLDVPEIRIDRLLQPGEIVLSGAEGRWHVGFAERLCRFTEALRRDPAGADARA